MEEVVIAILAKDKGYCLDFYLNCIANQNYDKSKIHLYIRTNDNKDNTKDILDQFIKKYVDEYSSIYYDNSSVSETLKKYTEHEWNSERFKILGKIRQESINYAINLNAHYFVVDCDNFITPNTLIDYDNNDFYLPILYREIKGLIEVDTIHCTYFLNKSILKEVTYDDNSLRYEYAIFSDNFRKKGITQYLDNSKFYGFLYLNDQIDLNFKKYVKTYWETEYNEMNIQ